MDDFAQVVWLKAGTIVKIDGKPFRLLENTRTLAKRENLPKSHPTPAYDDGSAYAHKKKG